VGGGKKLGTTKLEIPTITLDELLEREGVSQLDFLSMDIEGGEKKALAAFDLARYRPRLICIETPPEVKAWFDAYFSERGYQRLTRYDRFDVINSYYAPSHAE
jgi:hypothetical protein